MPRLFAMCLCLVAVAIVACSRPAEDNEKVISDIKSDENVVFFRTAAWFDEASGVWNVPIHGWIYEPEDSAVRLAVFAEILERQYGLVADAETVENFTSRFNLLIADNERDKQIVINIAGQDYEIPPSMPNGHMQTTLQITADQARQYEENGVMRYRVVTAADEQREFEGEVMLVLPDGLSIISDIDDTVKVTGVTDRSTLLENTFLLDFQAVPGMARLFQDWVGPNVSLHYVSSSPWQLYGPIETFLGENSFPRAEFRLKPVRFRDESILDLFKKGTETKPAEIEKILQTYPGRKFVLFGDSGEQDPEVYASMLRKYPDQIRRIYIRNVTGETPDNERFSAVFSGLGRHQWQLFDEPMGLSPP